MSRYRFEIATPGDDAGHAHAVSRCVVAGALEADGRRPKQDRRTATARFAALKTHGHDSSHPVLTPFIRLRRLQASAHSPTRTVVPPRFELREALPFGWRKARRVSDG